MPRVKGANARWTDFAERNLFGVVAVRCRENYIQGRTVSVEAVLTELSTGGLPFKRVDLTPIARVKTLQAEGGHAVQAALQTGKLSRRVRNYPTTTKKALHLAFYRVVSRLRAEADACAVPGTYRRDCEDQVRFLFGNNATDRQVIEAVDLLLSRADKSAE